MQLFRLLFGLLGQLAHESFADLEFLGDVLVYSVGLLGGSDDLIHLQGG